MTEKKERIKYLTEHLNAAAKAYYQEDREIMTNLEYDTLYDELLHLEEETGIRLGNSPTVHVGYEVLGELPKEAHESPMLSLDKTKDSVALASWLGEQTGLLSWKLDGLTIVLTYQNGRLTKAVTRGNGEIGEVITNNAKVFANLPVSIPYQNEVVLRGEAVITYSDFEKINSRIEDIEARYKNPRNLCSGSVRQLNNEITAQRNVHFFAFRLVKADGMDFNNSHEQEFIWLQSQGFEVVEYRLVIASRIEEEVEWFSGRITENDFPSDGLVLLMDDIAYGNTLGRTAKFPRDAIAFKWADEMADTTLLEMEWSASRTGLINPVAIFESVELEGSTVSRASVHNLSIMENLELGIGDQIKVYKANMIIPQIAENLTRSGNLIIPESCPVCGSKTVIHQENDVKSLYCPNEECLAKRIKSFTHFVSRDAMNVDGLSEATIEKLIGKGMIHELTDLFHIDKFKDEIIEMEGFGEKSFSNLIDTIEKARKTTLPKFIYSLGIPNIGIANAKLICKEYDYDLDKIRSAEVSELVEIQGIGDVIAETFAAFFASETNRKMIEDLSKELEIKKEKKAAEEAVFSGMNFVITGSLEHFSNRNEAKEKIEERGGKVTGSVTSKTNYLINNDNTSNSSKNKKARELDIPIITEEEFLQLMN